MKTSTLGRLAVVIFLTPLALAAQAQYQACPKLSGHYRVADFGKALGDTLLALNAEQAGFTDSEVKFIGPNDVGISIWIKSGSTGKLPEHPSRVLRYGSDFTCKDGWVVLTRTASSSRKSE